MKKQLQSLFTSFDRISALQMLPYPLTITMGWNHFWKKILICIAFSLEFFDTLAKAVCSNIFWNSYPANQRIDWVFNFCKNSSGILQEFFKKKSTIAYSTDKILTVEKFANCALYFILLHIFFFSFFSFNSHPQRSQFWLLYQQQAYQD